MLRKSVGCWADALSGHMASHGGSEAAVPEIVLAIFSGHRDKWRRVRLGPGSWVDPREKTDRQWVLSFVYS